MVNLTQLLYACKSVENLVSKQVISEKETQMPKPKSKNPIPVYASVYQLKVALTDIEPQIWRRFLVTGDQTLYRLHLILQTIMGWENYHLYEFIIGGTEYGEPDEEYQPDIELARKNEISQVLHREGQKFSYIYDYGDNWEHEIEVERISEPKPNVFYPVCLDGERASPPEDCGGVSGYAELLDALRYPEHTEHEHLVSWSEGFDPEAFDWFSVNKELRRHAQNWPMSFSVSSHRGFEPLPTVSSVNRLIAIIKPKKPFLDWLRSLPDWDLDITLKDLRTDCMAILIPEFDSNEEALDYVEYNHGTFFEMQLHNWYRDNSVWPEKRTLTMFRRWFDVEIHSMVYDTSHGEVEKEYDL